MPMPTYASISGQSWSKGLKFWVTVSCQYQMENEISQKASVYKAFWLISNYSHSMVAGGLEVIS